MKKYLFATIMLVTVIIFASKVNASGFYTMLEVNIPAFSGYTTEAVTKDTNSYQYMKTVYVKNNVNVKVVDYSTTEAAPSVVISGAGTKKIVTNTLTGYSSGRYVLNFKPSFILSSVYTGNWVLDEYLIK